MVPAGYTEEEVERAQIAALAKIRELKPKMCVAGVCKSTPCWCMREVICAALSTLPTREAMRAEIERLTKIIDNHNADAAARGGDRIRFPLAAVEAEAEIERLTGVIGHIQEHLTRDEDFDADELLRDIRDSVDLSEFDRLVLRAEAAERKLAEARNLLHVAHPLLELCGEWELVSEIEAFLDRPSPEEKGG